jgi:hypothetical protein
MVSLMDSATPNGRQFDIYLDVNVSVVVNVETEDDAAVVFHEMEEYMEREGEFSFLHRRVLYGRGGASHASYQVSAVMVGVVDLCRSGCRISLLYNDLVQTELLRCGLLHSASKIALLSIHRDLSNPFHSWYVSRNIISLWGGGVPLPLFEVGAIFLPKEVCGSGCQDDAHGIRVFDWYFNVLLDK